LPGAVVVGYRSCWSWLELHSLLASEVEMLDADERLPEYRKSSLVIRLVLAVWIAVIVVVLCATGRWWGLVFVVPLVLDLYLIRRILGASSSG